MALTILCLTNAFCILYSLNYVSIRDNSFQYSLLKVILLQYVIEILYYETCQCVFVQIVIPLLISDEVKKSCQIYKYIADQKKQYNRIPDIINICQFTHVSHMLATRYPDSPGKFMLKYT